MKISIEIETNDPNFTVSLNGVRLEKYNSHPPTPTKYPHLTQIAQELEIAKRLNPNGFDVIAFFRSKGLLPTANPSNQTVPQKIFFSRKVAAYRSALAVGKALNLSQTKDKFFSDGVNEFLVLPATEKNKTRWASISDTLMPLFLQKQANILLAIKDEVIEITHAQFLAVRFHMSMSSPTIIGGNPTRTHIRVFKGFLRVRDCRKDEMRSIPITIRHRGHISGWCLDQVRSNKKR